MTKTHWKRYDSRVTSLKITIDNLSNGITELNNRIDEVYWYDILWFLEESEPIFGLGFITLQNYINSSIYDKYNNLKKQNSKYEIGEKFNNSGRTKIELIIALANYFKHRDHPADLWSKTSEILTDFNIQFHKNVEIVKSPIFIGLKLLSENSELFDLVKIVENWREELWKSNVEK